MSPQSDWSARKKRLVKCKTHGLHYDSELTAGCTLCRKGATPPPRSPQTLIFLTLLLAFVVTIFGITKSFRERRAAAAANTAEEVAESTKVPSRLDAAAYRQPIEALEDALFESSSVDFDSLGGQVYGAVVSLARTLHHEDSTLASRAAQRLEDLSEAALPGQFTARALGQMRQEWLHIRQASFFPLPWMYGSTESVGALDRAAVIAYRTSAEELQGLASQGLAQASAIAEADSAFSGAGIVEPIPWNAWAEDWQQRIAAVQERLPERPSSRNSGNFLAAVQGFEQALGQLQALASDPRLPESTDFEARFERAINAAERAGRAFGELLLS